jgi:hypothetical protein
MRTIRTITWNLSDTGDIGPKIELLREAIREAGDDTGVIVCLQEVTSQYYRELLNCGLFSEVVCSLNVRSSERFDPEARPLGCAFGCTGKINLGTGSITGRLPDMDASDEMPPPSPDAGHGMMLLVNVHSINGIGFNKIKSARSASVARYLYSLAKHNESVIFCGKISDDVPDENDHAMEETSPSSGDRPDPAGTFFGVNPRHHLREALKMWLKSNPVCMVSRLQSSADGPLSVTLIKGGDHHYDFLFISPQWVVKHIDQRHDESLRAGSRHAMVVCDLAREAA